MIGIPLLLLLTACTPAQLPQSGTLGRYDFAAAPRSTLKLEPPLREVSGIVLSDDGRLFGHNDERGTVYQIDRSDGRIVKQFAVGEWRLREDLEDIAIVPETPVTIQTESGKGSKVDTDSVADPGTAFGADSTSGETEQSTRGNVTFYFVNSKGDLFVFPEGQEKTHVPFTQIKTELSARNDVEGLCYDPDTHTLLLACKEYPGKGLNKVRAVYSYSLREDRLLLKPRFLIDLKELKDRFGLKGFQPSGITRHPLTGNFFIISGPGNSIIEITPEGEVLSTAHLNKRYNEQPEGIVFDSDGTLYIASEGKRRGSISVYTPEPSGEPDE